MEYLILASLICFILFLIPALRNPARLRVGFLFCVFLVVFGLTLVILALNTQSAVLGTLVVIIAFIALAVLAFGLYVLIGMLLLNARVMHRRERHTLANRLPLIFALALLGYAITSWAMAFFNLPYWVRSLYFGFTLVVLFYFFHIFVFLTSDLLCTLARPRKNKDYIIVLGASLVDGRVSPLLARRVDAAIKFYRKQAKKRPPPRLVMSGGKGDDEALSEAAAMRNYALECGIPEADILLEDAARNTYENMLFSKALIEKDHAARGGAQKYRAIFATSGYHLLRSGMLAHKVGLPIIGIGGKTALYYLPTALLREYIAYLRMRWKPLVVIAVLLFLLGVALMVFMWWMRRYIL